MTIQGDSSYAADSASVRQAFQIIEPVIHRTPVLTCRTLDRLSNKRLFFKCENFQKVGAFKFRGACHAVARLGDDEALRGVATHSSGNHAQALALAAATRGIPAHIVMPSNALAVKRKAVEGYGARVYLCEPTLEARETLAQQVVRETGATLIPPYDHPHVIAGQGTLALELLDDVPDLDAVIAPVGGGGLLAGLSIGARSVREDMRILAAEPAGADDAARSLAAGKRILQDNPRTIADGLLTSLGELTWPIIRDHVESIVTVTDDKTVAAMRLVWERMKILIEPSAAVAVAAVLDPAFSSGPGMNRIGVVISGGNADLDHLPWSTDNS